ncbi:hypothetical protein D6D17_09917 [Aureobasidium pullulans]|nr:hypothetical protein D6D17_09917 [Aureobasidium pullulans]
MDPNPDTPNTTPTPGLFRYVLGFLLVGAAWGLTTPFMRRAAVASSTTAKPDSRAWIDHPNTPWLKAKVWGVLYGVWDVLRNPAYAVPLVINLTGSVWFFLLIGQAGEFFGCMCFVDMLVIEIKRNLDVWSCVADSCALELSLTVPITNSLAFLFTVLGEWWAEKKVITRDTWVGMALVLGGIGLCVHSKNT